MSQSPVPQLLVSVRDAPEARAALAGGADVVDVKEPSRGALGAADPAVWDAVLRACAGRAAVSVALGEAVDWDEEGRVPAVPAGAAFAKLGPFCLGIRSAHRDWNADLAAVRGRFEAAAGRPLPWAAVAYADARTASAPGPNAVLAAAAPAGCRAFLVDTFLKDGRGLFDHLGDEKVTALCAAAKARGLTVALAGSLRLEDFPRAIACGADVVAVRGAACDGGRAGRVSEAKVRALRETLGERGASAP